MKKKNIHNDLNKIVNYGLGGVGKTQALTTLADLGKKIAIIGLENNCLATLNSFQEALTEEQLSSFYLMPVLPRRNGLAAILSAAKDVLRTDPKTLQEKPDPKRRNYDTYTKMLEGMQHFVSMDGEDLGDIESWNSDYVLVLDSLTSVCWHIRNSVVGGSTFISLPAWGRMQALLQQFLRYLVDGLDCHVILLGHAIVQVSDITGIESIYPSTVGKALKDLVPTFFSEIVYSSRAGKKYYWSTSHTSAVTATRTNNLKGKDKIRQDYTQFKW